jgi:DNA-binding transcriptional LysR family regulator
MRVEQLQYIAAVARLGSFRRAAEELHISQPALSESVRKLESELGVHVLDRGRSGTTLSARGEEILPYVLDVIEASERLREAAAQDGEHLVVRLGAVAAAGVPLLTPAIRIFRERFATAQIEVVTAQQEQIQHDLRAGSLDLGLINYLDDEELPADLETTELLRGRPVLCIRPDSPLAARERVDVAELARQPLIAMRPGYMMYRYANRLLEGHDADFSYSADGAEMSKLMVAEGLGAALLPDYSVAGDQLEQRGAITFREIEGDSTEVMLVILRRGPDSATGVARDLFRIFLENAPDLTADR